MQFRTILNQVYKLPGFVYGKVRLLSDAEGTARLEVEVRPRRRSRPLCSNGIRLVEGACAIDWLDGRPGRPVISSCRASSGRRVGA